MKNYKKGILSLFALSILFSTFISCSRDTDELEEATYPTTPEVFIDGFSAGMEYEAFGESKLTSFNVDNLIKYKGEASMRFDVPNSGDPAGGFAAGLFQVSSSSIATVLNARDLSGYNVLTFWGKASVSASVDELGFGFTFDDEKYKAYIKDTPFSTAWTKYYIPIPDEAKLTQEKGLFYFVDAPDDGKGYSFWVDEVRFENLGTLGYKRASILNGENRVETAVNGSKITLSGLKVITNLPNGVDQEVIPAPAYFNFALSDNSVATVNNLGEITVTGAGTTTITGSVAGIDAAGSLKLTSTGLFVHAPTPMIDPANVISIFSNAYTNAPVEYYNGFWAPFQTTQSADFTIDGDDVLSYTDFNFVGTQFTVPTIDASDMTHLHLDLWLPNAVDPASRFLVRIVDLGPDGTFDDPNFATAMTYTSPDPLVAQQWISLDISLAGLASKDKLAQIIYENLGSPLRNFYVDNVYFYNDGNSGGGDDMPTVAAPTPMQDAANVISVYSDSYPNIEGTDLNPNWGQGTVVTGEMISGNNTLLYRNLNFQGIQLGSPQNVSGMDFLHIDYWTANSTLLNAFLISSGPMETGKSLSVPTSGWGSIDIPLSELTMVDLMDVIQMKFEGNGDIYLDNIYFYRDGNTGGGDMPTEAAPGPMEDPADVISVYSDAYDDIAGTNLNPGWGQSTIVTGEMIDGNNMLLYTGLNYQGIELGSSQDVTGMTHVHIDYWTANSSALNAYLISPGVETAKALSVPTPGWASIDIPLSDFSPVDLTNVIQFKFDGNGDIYLDNIYFYNDGGGVGETMPSQAAPTPSQSAENVISVYSDAYEGIAGTNFNPGWGQSTIMTGEMIDGNNMLLYTGLNYQGIELGSSQDVTGMTYLHIDYWTANSTALNAYLISPGAETAKALNVPTMGWSGIDIPLSDFAGVDLTNVIQFKFDGNGDIYLDNIYFYKEDGNMNSEPSLPLTFENGETLIAFDNGAFVRNIDNPDMNGNPSAKVLEFNKIVGSAWYSGMVFDESLRTTPLVDLSKGTVFSLKIWSPKSGINVRFQLEGGAAPAYEVFQTVETANQWVTLTFDFTSQVNASDTYPRISLFPDFNTSNQNPVAEAAIYYIDDITQQ